MTSVVIDSSASQEVSSPSNAAAVTPATASASSPQTTPITASHSDTANTKPDTNDDASVSPTSVARVVPVSAASSDAAGVWSVESLNSIPLHSSWPVADEATMEKAQRNSQANKDTSAVSGPAGSAVNGNGGSNLISVVPIPKTTEEIAQEALQIYHYLGAFADDFLHPASALAWLSRCRPARTGKITVPPEHRWPKSVHGTGGYMEAFRGLGLTQRVHETKLGHWHWWYWCPKRLCFEALQLALTRRWREAQIRAYSMGVSHLPTATAAGIPAQIPGISPAQTIAYANPSAMPQQAYAPPQANYYAPPAPWGYAPMAAGAPQAAGFGYMNMTPTSMYLGPPPALPQTPASTASVATPSTPMSTMGSPLYHVGNEMYMMQQQPQAAATSLPYAASNPQNPASLQPKRHLYMPYIKSPVSVAGVNTSPSNSSGNISPTEASAGMNWYDPSRRVNSAFSMVKTPSSYLVSNDAAKLHASKAMAMPAGYPGYAQPDVSSPPTPYLSGWSSYPPPATPYLMSPQAAHPGYFSPPAGVRLAAAPANAVVAQ